MVTECPKCQTTLTFEFQNLETGSETGCKHCDVRLKIKIVPEIIFDPSLPIEAPKDSKGTILLCIDGEATREVMKALLETLHYFVIDIPSGASALTNMKHNPPALAFVDSGLTDMSGAALCQEIKGSPNLSQTVVILIGSMFEKNAKYRQEAPDWAGADDYIDRHEIHKNLLTKVEHHLSEKEEIENEVLEPADQETCKPSLETVSESEKPNVISEGSGVSAEPEIDESSYLVKGARRLAKIIVSDIVIYNESKVEEGLKQDNFYELLESEILEGRQLYESRVDKSLYHAGIYEKALEAFIEKRTSESIQDIPESEKPTEILERPTAPTQETKPEIKEREETVSEEEKGETEPESAPENPSSETVEEHKILEESPISLEQARELSKTILSKIMETYGEKAQEGLKNGNLNEVLSNELMIGRQEFEEKAPAYFDSSIFEDTLEAYVASKAKVEDEAWQASDTPEIGSPQDVFQEIENQAQEIAKEPEPFLEDNVSESPEALENEAPQDVFQEMEDQAQEIAQEPEPEPALEDSAWEPPETLENEAPQDVFQEMENQAQEIAQEPEPEPALEDSAWESPETLENEAPQEVFQEMEDQAQEIAQEPESEPALEDSAWEAPETLENEAPQDVFQEMENQAQEIAQEPESEPALEDNAWESPKTLENEASQDVFQEMEDQAQEIAQEPEPEPALKDSAWESPEALENEAPQEVFQEMEDQTEEIAEEEQETFAAPPIEESTENTDSEETKNAKRLAKIIVSDIVIYNEKKVEKGLKNGTFYELLEDDIREGRVLFETRVSQTLFEAGLYENALEDFISSRNGTHNKDTLDSQKATEVFQKVEKVEPGPENSEAVKENKEEKDAKRLANIIVSDIMIYNEKKVEKGLQNGTFYKILEDDIREGRTLYESRVSPKILEEKNYLKEAFADFISKRTASLS